MNIFNSAKSLFNRVSTKVKSTFNANKQEVKISTTADGIRIKEYVAHHSSPGRWILAKVWRSNRPAWFKQLGFNSKIDAIKVHGSLTPIQPFGNFRSIKPLYGSNAWLRAKNPKYKLVA
ncbi:MAG: hypothetical protein P4L35_04760 [Ignavibacteriaceae bacterium]|nr:hypothetical protein [Ignavibacteriaceae bacterium]